MGTTRTVYVNGAYLPEQQAQVSVFDRGFLFADSVYEVSAVIDGQMIDNAAHLARLQRSLQELRMDLPCSLAELEQIQVEVIRRNQLQQGVLYLQVSRGVADRDFAFPAQVAPSLVMFTQAKNIVNNPVAEHGLRLITLDDIRWARRDIKTTALLAASLAKQAALDAGADDAWLVQQGYVTEGSAHNAFIVTQDKVLLTRQLGNEILHGITRAAILQLAHEQHLQIEERPFTVQEAYAAREAFISSASTFALPVVSIDGHSIADGKVGEIARRLRQLYIEQAMRGK